jgi:hypothetical protein
MFLNEMLSEFMFNRECFPTVVTLEEVMATVLGKLVLCPKFSRRISVQHLGAVFKSAYISAEVRKKMHFPVNSILDCWDFFAAEGAPKGYPLSDLWRCGGNARSALGGIGAGG